MECCSQEDFLAFATLSEGALLRVELGKIERSRFRKRVRVSFLDVVVKSVVMKYDLCMSVGFMNGTDADQKNFDVEILIEKHAREGVLLIYAGAVPELHVRLVFSAEIKNIASIMPFG